MYFFHRHSWISSLLVLYALVILKGMYNVYRLRKRVVWIMKRQLRGPNMGPGFIRNFVIRGNDTLEQRRQRRASIFHKRNLANRQIVFEA